MLIVMDSLLSILFFLFTLFSFNPFTSYASQLSYKDHCANILQDSPLTNSNKRPKTFPFGDHNTGFFKGGDRIIGINNHDDTTLRQFSFYLQPRTMLATESPELFKFQGLLSFRSTNAWNFTYSDDSSSYSFGRRRKNRHRNYVTFKLDGFWSESSGKVCMVGSGTGYSRTGDTYNIDAVFKLDNVFNSSNITSLVIGSFESLSSEKNDQSYFEPISVLMLPKGKYNYTLDSTESDSDFSLGSEPPEQGLSLDFNSLSFCSYPLSEVTRVLQLEYSSGCSSSSKNCTPIIGGSGTLPSFMSLKVIECSHTEKHSMRVLVEFMNNSYYYTNQGFNPKTMLVGEGWWNEKNNLLCVSACHVMDMKSSSSMDGARVGDCSLRLKLRFPSIWSIKNTGSVEGQIWSNKTSKEKGYFKKITFRNDQNPQVGGHGLKYEYSQLERIKKSCQTPKPVNGQLKRYPDAYSYDMRFDMSVREAKKRVAWGSSSPLSIGDKFYWLDTHIIHDSFSGYSTEIPTEILNNDNSSLFNISYRISMSVMSYSTLDDRTSLFNKSSESAKISAEGTYDAESGTLCMVGCRDLPPNIIGTPVAHSLDCEILLKFQFPPLDGNDGSRIKGKIQSTRKESDPLYFKPLDVMASSYYMEAARRNAWRMDMEVIMALISTTLACVFVALQLYHVKRNPNVLPFISLIMMSILTFGYMTPLVLNLEALLSQNPNNKNFVYGIVGWLEVNEISIRLITMVAFLLQSRLLYLTWSSRKANDSKESLWKAEKKAAFVTFPLYAAGLLITLIFNLKKDGHKGSPNYMYTYANQYPSSPSWENFKSYGGLVFDGFLLPQIILNLFSNLKENVLSSSFYFGTTFVRLLPHAYDLYRTHYYAQEDDVAYFYADPSADFYSTAWDVVIPLGGILFAILIYLQQKFGALCFLPQRFKGSIVYEKVPVNTESEAEMETSSSNI